LEEWVLAVKYKCSSTGFLKGTRGLEVTQVIEPDDGKNGDVTTKWESIYRSRFEI